MLKWKNKAYAFHMDIWSKLKCIKVPAGMFAISISSKEKPGYGTETSFSV